MSLYGGRTMWGNIFISPFHKFTVMVVKAVRAPAWWVCSTCAPPVNQTTQTLTDAPSCCLFKVFNLYFSAVIRVGYSSLADMCTCDFSVVHFVFHLVWSQRNRVRMFHFGSRSEETHRGNTRRIKLTAEGHSFSPHEGTRILNLDDKVPTSQIEIFPEFSDLCSSNILIWLDRDLMLWSIKKDKMLFKSSN